MLPSVVRQKSYNVVGRRFYAVRHHLKTDGEMREECAEESAKQWAAG